MDELTEFQKQYLGMLNEEENEELTKNSELISSFKQYMAKKGLFLKEDNFKYFPDHRNCSYPSKYN